MDPTDEQRKPVLSTMWGDEDDRAWSNLVDVVRTDHPGGLRDLLTLWRESRGREAVILRGSVSLSDRYRDLVFAALLRLRRNGPSIVISDATWEAGSHSLTDRLPERLHPMIPPMIRGFISLVDAPNVRYGVLSTTEVNGFPRMWGIAPDRVVFTPFKHTVHDRTLHPRIELDVVDKGYLFSGGDSLRDYAMLEKAIEGLDIPVELATHWKPSSASTNVTAGRRSHEDFQRLLAGAHAVVIPLQASTRSSGQQSYLNAMVLGKPVIVTEAPGVRDYIEDGVTGVIVPSHPVALREAIEDVMDPRNEEKYRTMGERARRAVEDANHDFTYRRLLLRTAGLNDALIEEAAAAPAG